MTKNTGADIADTEFVTGINPDLLKGADKENGVSSGCALSKAAAGHMATIYLKDDHDQTAPQDSRKAKTSRQKIRADAARN